MLFALGCATTGEDSCTDAESLRGDPGCEGTTPGAGDYLGDDTTGGKTDDETLPSSGGGFSSGHQLFADECDAPWETYAEWSGSVSDAPCAESMRECLLDCRGAGLNCQVECLLSGSFSCRACLSYTQTACPYRNGCGDAAVAFDCCAEDACGGGSDTECVERACGEEITEVRACVADPAVTDLCSDYGHPYFDDCF